jgi:hypothetical protein
VIGGLVPIDGLIAINSRIVGKPEIAHPFLGIDESQEGCNSEDELQAMIRKPHTDYCPTPATFMWQGAGKGTVM